MRSDISKSENSTSVRYNSYSVGFDGIFVSQLFVPCDKLTGLRNSRCISKSQVFTGLHPGLGLYLKLPLPLFV